MNLTDLLYDNFIGIFGNVWYQKLLAIVLLTVYFYSDVQNRFSPCPPYVKKELNNEESETEGQKDTEFNELDLESKETNKEETPKVQSETEHYSSDFISESESDSESASREKTLIKKHFKILNDIQSTKFKTKTYSCSYHYLCVNNDSIKLECCFCKICGNYICSNDTPSPKIMCTHYKLFDSIDSRLDIFSGHIRTDDEEDVRNTMNSFFETGDELEMQFYRTRLRQFVCDEVESDKEGCEEKSDSDSD